MIQLNDVPLKDIQWEAMRIVCTQPFIEAPVGLRYFGLNMKGDEPLSPQKESEPSNEEKKVSVD